MATRLGVACAVEAAESQGIRTACALHGKQLAGRRVAQNDVVPLPSQAAVRIGPFYFYFLLPRPADELDAIATAYAAAVASTTRKGRATLRQAVSEAIAAFRDPLGYSTIQDFLRVMHEAVATHEHHETEDQLRKMVHGLLRRAGSGWEAVRAAWMGVCLGEFGSPPFIPKLFPRHAVCVLVQVELDAVPPHIAKEITARFSRRPTTWFRRVLAPGEPEPEAWTAPPPAPPSSGGGEDGGGRGAAAMTVIAGGGTAAGAGVGDGGGGGGEGGGEGEGGEGERGGAPSPVVLAHHRPGMPALLPSFAPGADGAPAASTDGPSSSPSAAGFEVSVSAGGGAGGGSASRRSGSGMEVEADATSPNLDVLDNVPLFLAAAPHMTASPAARPSGGRGAGVPGLAPPSAGTATRLPGMAPLPPSPLAAFNADGGVSNPFASARLGDDDIDMR